MSDYTAPVRDIRFVLEHLAGLPELASYDAFSHADPDMVASLLEEAGRFCSCLLYTSPSPRDLSTSRMPSSA